MIDRILFVVVAVLLCRRACCCFPFGGVVVSTPSAKFSKAEVKNITVYGREPFVKRGQTQGTPGEHPGNTWGKPRENLRNTWGKTRGNLENLGYTWTNMEKPKPNLAIWNFVP